MSRAWLRLLRIEKLTEQRMRCHYCMAPLTAARATADHKWPRARHGGADRANIVAACYPCNQAKRSMSHIEFYRLIRRKFPAGAPMEIILVWSARRLWKKTHRACERIERMVSPYIVNHGK